MGICSKCKKFPQLKNQTWCSLCFSKYHKKNRLHRIKNRINFYIKYPWLKSYKSAKERCNRPNAENYWRYGGRGIKFLLTKNQIKKLWFRDKAYLLKRPSIDRKENDGNYTFKNCKFIEMVENNKKSHIKTIFQYNIKGIFIKHWDSAVQASVILQINLSGIYDCLNGKLKSSGNYIWKRS